MVRSRGFVLMGTVLLVLAVGVLLAMMARLWESDARRERERELLWIGSQFRAALAAYAAATPEGHASSPRQLEQLLLDRRVDPPRRHLRRIYVDPMTAQARWDLLRDADGGIVGVRSRATERPLADDGLWPLEPAFAGARRYADWVFMAPGAAAPRP